jgi:DnaK suppressor protein
MTASNLLTEEELLATPDTDDYMNDRHLAFFRDLLVRKKTDLEGRINSYRVGLKDAVRTPDDADFASNEEQRNINVSMLAMEREKLLEVNKALEAIQQGDYGYCIDSGYPIGFQRLLIKPETFYSVEAMRAKESHQRHIARF